VICGECEMDDGRWAVEELEWTAEE
jgi:hypothetical protein